MIRQSIQILLLIVIPVGAFASEHFNVLKTIKNQTEHISRVVYIGKTQYSIYSTIKDLRNSLFDVLKMDSPAKISDKIKEILHPVKNHTEESVRSCYKQIKEDEGEWRGLDFSLSHDNTGTLKKHLMKCYNDITLDNLLEDEEQAKLKDIIAFAIWYQSFFKNKCSSDD